MSYLKVAIYMCKSEMRLANKSAQLFTSSVYDRSEHTYYERRKSVTRAITNHSVDIIHRLSTHVVIITQSVTMAHLPVMCSGVTREHGRRTAETELTSPIYTCKF